MQDDRELPGYRSTVHYSLLVVPRLKGVPYRPAVIMWLATVILSLMWQTLAFAPIALLAHFVLQSLTKHDVHTVPKTLRSWKHPACFAARGRRRYQGLKQLRRSIYVGALSA